MKTHYFVFISARSLMNGNSMTLKDENNENGRVSNLNYKLKLLSVLHIYIRCNLFFFMILSIFIFQMFRPKVSYLCYIK